MPLKPGYSLRELSRQNLAVIDAQTLTWHNIGSLHWKHATCASLWSTAQVATQCTRERSMHLPPPCWAPTNCFSARVSCLRSDWVTNWFVQRLNGLARSWLA